MKTVLDIVLFFATVYLVYMAYQFFIKPELKKQIQKEIISSGINDLINAGDLKADVITQLKEDGYIIKPVKVSVKNS